MMSKNQKEREEQIKFAEYLAHQNYVLYDIVRGVSYWSNGKETKTTKQLLREYELIRRNME